MSVKAVLLTVLMVGNAHGPVVEVPMPNMETCAASAEHMKWVFPKTLKIEGLTFNAVCIPIKHA